MPRKTAASASAVTSAFRQVQRQARSLLTNLRREIRDKENELRRLRDEESRLKMLTGQQTTRGSRDESGGIGSGRINWSAVLEQLPRQFRASDVRAVRGLKEKRPSEVFAAITRWISGGKAKRRSRGIYEKS